MTATTDPSTFIDRRTRLRRSVLLAAIGFFILFLYLFSPFLLVLIGWFLDPYADQAGAAVLSHRVHEVTFGLLFGMAMVGALAQLRRPERNVAGMQQIVVVVGAFVLVSLFTTGFELVSLAYVIPVAVAVWAHPQRRRVLLPAGRPHAGLLMLALVLLIGLTEMIGRELFKAVGSAQGHEAHWGTMAAFAITLVVLSFLVAFRPPGWRVTAGTVVVAMLGYVAASLVFPFDASARPGSRAVLATSWTVAMVLAMFRAGRPRSKRRRLPGWAWAALSTPLVLFIGFVWSFPGEPTRIPHQVATSQLDRAGCLSCHLEVNIAATGATATPHPQEACGDDPEDPPCLEGQSDCLACHRLGPGAVVAGPQAWPMPRGGPSLSASSLSTLRGG